MHYSGIFTCSLLLLSLFASAQTHVLHFTSPHTSFPDTGRVSGHTSEGVFYPAAGHYDDSSVLMVVPDQWRPAQKIDLVLWFHGWHNNIDTALEFYGLARQFVAARRNAVLVLPEAAKNSADSYAGKLQQKGMFKAFVYDVMRELKKARLVPENSEPGKIVLAGHSGGYLAIADILAYGEMPVNEVFLFDALYSQVDKFMDWIEQDKSNHFLHWFTNQGGGTDETSDTMMLQLKNRQLPYRLVEENSLTPARIRASRILFVHSHREHNVIINTPDDFRELLENSFWLSR